MSQLDHARGQHVRIDENAEEIKEDSPPKRTRLYVVSASILRSSVAPTRQMPLDLDNGLPGILVRFGSTDEEEISFTCLVDTCAAMNTGNLKVHQWIMTQYPSLVAEYVQYDDENPFEPLKLECAVKDIPTENDDSSKLTAIVRYWTRYTEPDGKRAIISFGLGKDIAVNSIIGMPTIRKWGMNLCFMTSTITANHIKVRFSTEYARSKHGLPPSVQFDSSEFVRPLVNPAQTQGNALITNISNPVAEPCIGVTDGCPFIEASTPADAPVTVTDTTENGYLRRTISTQHIE